MGAVLLLLPLGLDKTPLLPVEERGRGLPPDWAPAIPLVEPGGLEGSDWASPTGATKEPEGLLRPVMPALGAATDMEAAPELV